jgi:S-DNA-T family DNA segregation ATPase FtsK/SpoIIIE
MMTRKRVKGDTAQGSRFQLKIDPSRQREIMGLALFAFGGLLLLSLLRITPSALSERAAQFLFGLFGWGAFVLPLLAFGGSAYLMRRGAHTPAGITWGRLLAAELFFAAALALLHLGSLSPDGATLADKGGGGGFIGWAISGALSAVIGGAGAGIILTALALFTLPAVAGLSPTRVTEWSQALAAAREPQRRSRPAPAEPSIEEPPLETMEPEPVEEEEIEEEPIPPVSLPVRRAPSLTAEGTEAEENPSPMAQPPPITHPIITTHVRMRRRNTSLPSIDLLEAASETRYGDVDAQHKGDLIIETLANFGIPAQIVETNPGPTVTQFGLEPGFLERRGTDGQVRKRKISVSRIAALQHDLELALAAAPIRIETPVPGRPVVGIEVPNQSVALVSLRGILESDVFKKKKSSLKMVLGRDVSGAPIVADLASMPHLLIAGATGSGKSVCINSIIACLLFDNSPDDLRLIMVDPKRVELVNFNGIPHLLGPVVVDIDQVVPALRWVVAEMDSRFKAFAKVGVRNVEAYNDKLARTDGGTKMPYLVLVIDELADLMLAAPDETEKLLTRLAQLARATGIHLVIATQRPSVDVVTGLIKANFPARISFAVTSSVDSRVVLDTPGAEKLLGRGDMLYMSSDSSKLLRLQGCYVSDDELARLANHWRDRAITEGREMVHEPPWAGQDEAAPESGGDELLARATKLVRQSETASISYLQRKLGIGYPRAARLMDQLEAAGVVGPDEGGGKPRAVLPASPAKGPAPERSKKK